MAKLNELNNVKDAVMKQLPAFKDDFNKTYAEKILNNQIHNQIIALLDAGVSQEEIKAAFTKAAAAVTKGKDGIEFGHLLVIAKTVGEELAPLKLTREIMKDSLPPLSKEEEKNVLTEVKFRLEHGFEAAEIREAFAAASKTVNADPDFKNATSAEKAEAIQNTAAAKLDIIADAWNLASDFVEGKSGVGGLPKGGIEASAERKKQMIDELTPELRDAMLAGVPKEDIAKMLEETNKKLAKIPTNGTDRQAVIFDEAQEKVREKLAIIKQKASLDAKVETLTREGGSPAEINAAKKAREELEAKQNAEDKAWEEGAAKARALASTNQAYANRSFREKVDQVTNYTKDNKQTIEVEMKADGERAALRNKLTARHYDAPPTVEKLRIEASNLRTQRASKGRQRHGGPLNIELYRHLARQGEADRKVHLAEDAQKIVDRTDGRPVEMVVDDVFKQATGKDRNKTSSVAGAGEYTRLADNIAGQYKNVTGDSITARQNADAYSATETTMRNDQKASGDALKEKLQPLYEEYKKKMDLLIDPKADEQTEKLNLAARKELAATYAKKLLALNAGKAVTLDDGVTQVKIPAGSLTSREFKEKMDVLAASQMSGVKMQETPKEYSEQRKDTIVKPAQADTLLTSRERAQAAKPPQLAANKKDPSKPQTMNVKPRPTFAQFKVKEAIDWVKSVVTKFDKASGNGDNQIAADELRMADKDKDGKISGEELANALKININIANKFTDNTKGDLARIAQNMNDFVKAQNLDPAMLRAIQVADAQAPGVPGGGGGKKAL